MKMNREELKELGLTDEQIESVMKSHGKATNDLKTKADSVDGLESQIEDYKGQLADRDGQLEALSKVDAEGLQTEIDRLKGENETTATEFQGKLDQQAFDFSLERALTDAKVRNPKAVKALLDTETIKLDGETLLGLDDQLKSLQESDEYLFESEETPDPTPQIVTKGNPNGGTTTAKSIADMNYQELADLKASDPTAFAELTK